MVVSNLVPLTMVLNCSGTGHSTKSPSLGIMIFISLDLAETISTPKELELKYTWHPSVFSMLTVGTLSITCIWQDWQLTISQAETKLSKTTEVFLQESKITELILPWNYFIKRGVLNIKTISYLDLHNRILTFEDVNAMIHSAVV